MEKINTFYRDLKIKPKLLLSFSFIILILLAIVSITFYSLNRLDKRQKDLIKNFEVADGFMEMKFTISQDLTLLMEIMTSDTKEELNDFWKEHENLIGHFNEKFNYLTQILDDQDWGEEYGDSKKNLKKTSLSLSDLYKTNIQATIQKVYELRAQLITSNVNFILDSIVSQSNMTGNNFLSSEVEKNKLLKNTIAQLDNQSDSLGTEMFKVFTSVEDTTQSIVDKSRLNSQKVDATSKTASAIFSLIGLLFSILLAIFIANRISKPVVELNKNVEILEHGNFPEELKAKENDEIGLMVQAINSLTRTLKNIALFAQDVGNNKLDVEADFNSEGVLGNSLINMRNSLKKVSIEDKKRNWVTVGIAQFADLLRSEQEDIRDLGDTIISKLVKYTNSNQGSLFVLNEENEKESFLELLSCYAWDRKKYSQKRLAIGEGLIGQAVQEGEYIYLTDVPDNYVSITSGLGDSNPRSILIMPMKLNEEVLGVIELASFNPFEQHQIDFVQKIGESIASTIKTAKVNIRTKKLLAESQSMTEELKSQEEEMRQNMEEMHATQEEMNRLMTETNAQNTIINSTAIVSKTDLKGNITYVNEEFVRWSKYSREELMGRNHRILKSGEQPDEIFVEMWKTISSGKIFRGQIKNKAKDGSFYWVDAIIAPVLDSYGKPKEYIAQRFVINEQKEKEENMRQMMEEAQAQEEEIRQNMEELQATQEEMGRLMMESNAQNSIINSTAIVSKTDLKGNITYVNDEFLKWSKYSLKELIGQNHNIIRHPDMPKEAFEDLWRTISSGKIWRGEVKNRAKDGSHYWVDAIIAPILGANGKPREYIAQRFVINEQKEREDNMRQMMEEAQAHEEEIRQSLEELQVTNEQMSRVQRESEAQLNLMNKAAIVSKTDLKGNITYVNDEFCRAAKYTRKELLGKKHNIVRHPDMPKEAFEDLWRTISSGKVWRGKVKNRAKDGTHYWVDATIAPVLGENGKPVEYMAVRFLITEFMDMQEKLNHNK